VALALLLPASPALAADEVKLEMMVSRLSDKSDAVDKRGMKILEKMRKKGFRYKGLEVLKQKTKKVGLDEVVSIRLPNGKKARVSPISIDGKSALLAVDVPGGAKVDARARSGHLLVFSAGSDGGGALVVSVERRD